MIEYTIKKQSLLFPALGCLLFILLGLLMAVGVIGPVEGGTEADNIGGIVLGWLVILFFGGGFVFVVFSIIKKEQGPDIRIDEEGFFDRRVCSKPIPWSAIRSAYIFRGKTVYASAMRFISLDVIEPDNYQRKGIDRYFPRLFKLLKKLYDEPGITIHTGLLDQSPEEILSGIEKESKGVVLIKR